MACSGTRHKTSGFTFCNDTLLDYPRLNLTLSLILREGYGRMTIFGAASNARTFDYQAGDVGYVPAGFGTSPLYLRGAYLFMMPM